MITPVYASVLALLLIGLSLNVITARKKLGAGLGDAGNVNMQRRIRAQGNLAEYAPMFLILLACAETGGLPVPATHLTGAAFLAGRAMHAYSLLSHEKYDGHRLMALPIWRMAGMICTFGTIGLLAVTLLVQAVTR